MAAEEQSVSHLTVFSQNAVLFDDLPDETIVLVLLYLDITELSHVKFISQTLSKLSNLNEIWKPLYTSNWQHYYRYEEWIENAHEEERIALVQSSPNQTTIWKSKYLDNLNSLTYDLQIFSMSHILTIGVPMDLHWFEPRYRWLAFRCASLPADKRIICYSDREPYVGGVAFICKMTSIELFDDGRALVTLLPVANCKFNKIWHETVPTTTTVPNTDDDQDDDIFMDEPKLACGNVKELSSIEYRENDSQSKVIDSGGPELNDNELMRVRLLELINNAAREQEGVSLQTLANAPETRQLFRLLEMLQDTSDDNDGD